MEEFTANRLAKEEAKALEVAKLIHASDQAIGSTTITSWYAMADSYREQRLAVARDIVYLFA